MTRIGTVTIGGLIFRLAVIALFTFSSAATGWHHDWWPCAALAVLTVISSTLTWKETR